jgi:general stress protein YciG
MATTKNQNSQKETDTSKRGFASMDDKKQKEIASKGGKASHGGGGNNKSGK